MSNILIIDIETLSQPEAEIRAKLPPFDPAKVKLGVLKDEAKIEAKIEEARRTHGNDDVADGALHATTGTLAIVGFRHGDNVIQYHAGEMTETAIIEASFAHILRALDKGVIISGYFIKGFDLPFLVGRAWALGIKVPSRVFNALKPRYPFSEAIVCLQEVWLSGSGAQFGTRVSLASVLRELGLPPKSGTGADFGAMWTRYRADALRYNADDLACEMRLAERLI